MEKTMINDLTTGSVGKELLRFSFPFMLSNALQTVYNLVDMVIVGQFVGSAGLTAVSLGGQITWLLSCLAIGYASGGQIFISQLVGTRDHEGIRRTIGTLFTAIALFSILFTVLGIAGTLKYPRRGHGTGDGLCDGLQRGNVLCLRL